jgi:peptidoglycan/xylan/chitin deacetylase (PgdA/CDA1 family)
MMSTVRSSPSALFKLLSPAGGRARLFIFLFHRVLARPDAHLPTEPDAERFDAIVSFIARNFRVLPLSEAVQRLGQGTLPAATACITFDDGYADNYTVAAPILRRHGVSAAFFIASGYADGRRMWNDSVIEAARRAPAGELDWTEFGLGRHPLADAASRVTAYEKALAALKYRDAAARRDIAGELARRAGLPERDATMMTPAQVRQLREMGMDIGGHTVTHPILSRLNDADAAAEIADNRAQLAEWVGEPPRTFAYPNGRPGRDYTARDVELVRRSGYAGALTTMRGVGRMHGDPYQLPRFTPWDRAMPRFAVRCATTLLLPQRMINA